MKVKFASIAAPEARGYAYDTERYGYSTAAVDPHYRSFPTFGDGLTQHGDDSPITVDFMADYLASLAGDGTFLAEGALAQLLSEHGIEHDGRLGAYCGSGVTASITLAALATMGCQAALFPGSWSEWSSDPARAVAREPE